MVCISAHGGMFVKVVSIFAWQGIVCGLHICVWRDACAGGVYGILMSVVVGEIVQHEMMRRMTY